MMAKQIVAIDQLHWNHT